MACLVLADTRPVDFGLDYFIQLFIRRVSGEDSLRHLISLNHIATPSTSIRDRESWWTSYPANSGSQENTTTIPRLEVTDVNRRDFLRGIVSAGAVSGGGSAMYFGYGKVADLIAVIGTGDEGNVLIGGCNPEYVDVTICDIRPFTEPFTGIGPVHLPSVAGRSNSSCGLQG